MEILSVKRGAIRSTPAQIAAAPRFSPPPNGVPSTYIIRPPQLSIWGNDVHGDCVTAEEAFAKACHAPELFVSQEEVISWAQQNGVLESASFVQVMDLMQNSGLVVGADLYCDGPYSFVDFIESDHLRSAIVRGPIKLAVASAQLLAEYWKQYSNPGWINLGFQHDGEIDHCISLCGFGTIGWLAGMLNFTLNPAVDKQLPAYAFFSWGRIGIMDQFTINAIAYEAWLRQPTTIVRPIPRQRKIILAEDQSL
jgi:hypothetical protein